MAGGGSLATSALLAPALVFLGICFVYPLGRLFLLSLEAPNFSFVQYAAFFSSPAYIAILRRTFLVSGSVTLICFILGYPTAYFLSQASARRQQWLLVLVVVPYLTSLLVRTYAWIVLLNDRGVVNRMIQALGISDRPIPLLYNTTGVFIGMVHIMLPMMILPLYSVMRGMNPNLVRAASAFGAGPIRSFLMVFLPLSLPGIRSGCILVFVISLGFYLTPAALGGLGDAMLSTLIAAQLSGALNFAFAAAAAFILLGITLILYAVLGGDIGFAGSGTLARSGSGRGPRPRLRLGRRTFLAAARRLGLAVLASSLTRRIWCRRLGRPARALSCGKIALGIVSCSILAFLAAPSVVVIIISFSADEFLAFPPSGWSLRWYASYFGDRSWLEPTLLSAEVAVTSAGAALVVGTAAAYALVRAPIPGGRLAYGLILSPMIVPLVVSGIALYGVLADWKLIGTWLGLVIAHTTGGITFVVIVVAATLSGVDRRLELAALSLGASPIRTFRTVILPLIKPGMIAGGLFAFIHSFDEVVITSFIGGIRLQTLPLKMWEDIRNQIDPTIAAVSALLVALPLLWMTVLGINRRPLPNS